MRGMRCRGPWHKPRRAVFRGFTRQSRLLRAAEAVPWESKKRSPKRPSKSGWDADVMAALRASGDGWHATHQRCVACIFGFEWKDFYRIRRPMEPHCRTEQPPRQSGGFDARKRSNCPKVCASVSVYFPSCYSANSHQTATECSKKALKVGQIRARAR